jgi:hypothetical protein
MALDWSYPKETHWIHREGGTRLEPSGGLKVRPSPKDLEEGSQGRRHGVRLQEWNEVTRIVVDRIRWKHFTDALCFRGSNRN